MLACIDSDLGRDHEQILHRVESIRVVANRFPTEFAKAVQLGFGVTKSIQQPTEPGCVDHQRSPAAMVSSSWRSSSRAWRSKSM